MAQRPKKKTQPAQLRRSPKLAPFVALSALIGFIGTAIVTSLFPSDPSLGFQALFAYFSLYGITGSVALGIVLWLVLDLRSRRGAVEVTLEQETD